MIVQIINVFGKLLLMMGVGFCFVKAGVLTKEMKKYVTTLLMKIILPFNILSSACHDFSMAYGIGILQVLLISGGFYAVSLTLLAFLTRNWKNKEKRGVFINLAVFANVGFIGFSVLGELLGEAGTLYTMAYNICYQLFFFSYGMFLIRHDEKFTIRKIFSNSIIYISLISIALYFSQWRFPEFIQSTISDIGGMMIPLSMILIGADIARLKFREMCKESSAYLLSALRLLVFPLIMAVILKLCHVDATVSTAVIILTGLPSGSLTVIAVQEEGKDSSFAAQAVAQSTLLMIVTLPILYILSEQLF